LRGFEYQGKTRREEGPGKTPQRIEEDILMNNLWIKQEVKEGVDLSLTGLLATPRLSVST
jgi:hypothetical protein